MEKTDLYIELHVPDFQKAIDFYKVLGFEVVWVSNDYLVMKRKESFIFFWDEKSLKHPYFGNFSKETKKGFGVEIVLFEKDVKVFYREIKEKVNVVEELKKQPWGRWDFRIEDVFGFYIRIGEPGDIINNEKEIANTEEIAKRKGLRI